MNSQYIAWVPCVSGRIFFHDLSPSLGNFDLYNIQRPVGAAWEVLISSVVDWRDNPQNGLPDQALFRIVVAAKIERQCFAGKVYILDRTLEDVTATGDRSDENYYYQPTPTDNSYYELNLLNEFDRITKENTAPFLTDINTLLDNSSANPVHVINFSIKCNGICRLQYCYSRSPSGKKYTPTNAKTGYLAARQAFYYLRDSIHKHVHHENQNDCITNIHPLADLKSNGSAILDGIKHSLSEIRSKLKRSYHSYAGIGAYYKSLLLILADEEMINLSRIPVEEKLIDNTVRSIEYKGLNSIVNSTSLLDDFKASLKSTSVYSLAIVAPFLVFLNTASRKGDEYAAQHTEEMTKVCLPLMGFLETTCNYLYNRSTKYMEGTLSPIIQILFELFAVALVISLLRISGEQYKKDKRIATGLTSIFRKRASSHVRAWGNFSYWMVRFLGFTKLNIRANYNDGKVARVVKYLLPLLLLFLTLLSLYVGRKLLL